MSTTAITLESQAQALQADFREQVAAFFASLPEITSTVAMSEALVAQAKLITVTDNASYVAATEQVQALKAVEDAFAELIDPFVEKAFKLHRTLTGIRKTYLDPGQAERQRLKLEREAYANAQERAPEVKGTSLRSAYEWQLQDRRKLKDEYLLVDEVAIGKLVRAMHQAAEQIVGEPGAIRVFERRVVVDR